MKTLATKTIAVLVVLIVATCAFAQEPDHFRYEGPRLPDDSSWERLKFKFIMMGAFMIVATIFAVITRAIKNALRSERVISRASLGVSLDDISPNVPTLTNRNADHVEESGHTAQWHVFKYADTPKELRGWLSDTPEQLHLRFLAESDSSRIQAIRVDLVYEREAVLWPVSLGQVQSLARAVCNLSANDLRLVSHWLNHANSLGCSKKFVLPDLTFEVFSTPTHKEWYAVEMYSSHRSNSAGTNIDARDGTEANARSSKCP